MKKANLVFLCILLSGCATQPKSSTKTWLHCNIQFHQPYSSQRIIVKNIPTADTNAKHRRGLSGPQTTPNSMMLFAWNKPAIRSFWMHRVNIPLTVAMINNRGVIIQLSRMKPNTTQQHWSKQPFLNAFEASPHWFQKTGIAVNSTVKILQCH